MIGIELSRAYASGNMRLLLSMLEQHPRYIASSDDRCVMDIFAAACERGHMSLIGMFIYRGIDVSKVCRGEHNALIRACANNHAEVVNILVSHGADPTVATPGGDTPLSTAQKRGNHDTIDVLHRFNVSR